MNQVLYLNKLELDKIVDKTDDYVIKTEYPIKFDTVSSLLEVEMQKRSLLDNVYLEFETVSLSGRQLINLCNNLNINVLVKQVTDEQMKELLIAYSEMPLHKVVYPAKLVVLISLMLLYRSWYQQEHIEEDVTPKVKEYLNKIKFAYIDDKYSVEFISEWVKWYLMYLLENKKEFVDNFGYHCAYLFESAYSFYKDKPIDRPVSTELSSGLYVPLAFVMRDMKFNPFKIVTKPNKYNYVVPTSMGLVIQALFPLLNYVIMVEDYLATEKKEEVRFKKLSDMTEKDILKAVKEKKRIIVEDDETDKFLFPLEIVKAGV